MNRTDYELLKRKGFIRDNKIDTDVVKLAALKEAIEFYTVLYMNNNGEQTVLDQLEKLLDLAVNNNFMHFHLLAQRMYGNITRKELDDLYVASLEPKILESFIRAFGLTLLLIDTQFCNGEGEIILALARGIRGYGH